jgi:serine protease DegQ
LGWRILESAAIPAGANARGTAGAPPAAAKAARTSVLRNNRGTRESGLRLACRDGEPSRTRVQDLAEGRPLKSMRNLWLIFAQTATVAVSVLFVVTTLKPEWLGRSGSGLQVVELRQATSSGGLPARAASYSDAVRKAVPSVVNIFTSKEIKTPRHPFLDDPLFRHFFGDRLEEEPQRAASLGSGVIVSPKGYILTNHHVVEAADEIEVALIDGKKLKAKAVGSDPETDIAVLQVEGGPVPAITFGDADALRVGDVVLAIGNPFGVGQTVTMGIVSALGRSQLGINTFENFIQTDAAINPGNSGGALIDSAGNLVGINTAIYSRSGGSLGIGFAIPASSAKQVMEQIIQTGGVTRGWIGVEAREITPEMGESFRLGATTGVLIEGVLRGGPAERAGLKPGDILIAIEGKPVKDPNAMLNLVAALVPGKPASIKLRRDNKDVDVQVSVGKRPTQQRRRR